MLGYRWWACDRPYGFGLIADAEDTRNLAEFGVVFLMFSIGLSSVLLLATMRRIVFGPGSQAVLTLPSLSH
jgi:CPA2 family monovalent cation:H+ antiporter-2